MEVYAITMDIALERLACKEIQYIIDQYYWKPGNVAASFFFFLPSPHPRTNTVLCNLPGTYKSYICCVFVVSLSILLWLYSTLGEVLFTLGPHKLPSI